MFKYDNNALFNREGWKMPDIDLGIGSPIKTFIEKIRKEATDGLADWELKAPIKLELSAIVKGKIGGGIDIEVVHFGAKVEAEQLQKVTMAIGPKSEAEEAEKKARIAEAEAKEKDAKLKNKWSDDTGVPLEFCKPVELAR